MADSKRQGHKSANVLDEETQTKKDRMFLVTFFLGAVALVAGMFWIAGGLSEDFTVTSPTFLTMVIAGGLSVASAVTSKILFREG